MGMPSRFQSKNIHRNLFLAELLCQLFQSLFISATINAIPHTKSPHGRHAATAGEQIVSLDDFHKVSREQIQFNPLCRRDIYDHFSFFFRSL